MKLHSLLRHPRTMQVVIYEDDLPTAQAYQLFLEHQGYAIQAFHDNEACRRAIRRHRPDLLICDVQNDVAESGLTLLDDLCNEFGKRLPPVIIATAYQPSQLRNHPTLRRLPLFRMLFKPFGLDELQEVINQVL